MRRAAVFMVLTSLLVLVACGADSGDEDAASSLTTAAPTTSPPATDETSTTDATTTTTEPTGPEIAVVLDDEQFGASHALTGPVVKHDGSFHLFYTAGEANFGDGRIAHAVSDDASNWSMAEDRVLVAADVPFAPREILPTSGVVLPDGTWVLYFHTGGNIYGSSGSVIGLATATAPEGPWTALPEPILQLEDSPGWDSQGVANPHVLLVGDEYVMWYDGHAGDQSLAPDRSIGIAVSDDGLTWNRSGTEPVLTPGTEGSWDELRVFDPNVVAHDDGFVMSFSTMRLAGQRYNHGYGLAVSDDGMTWTKTTTDEPYLWLIADGEFVVPGLLGSLGSTMFITEDGPAMYFDLLFPGYGQTYVVTPPVG